MCYTKTLIHKENIKLDKYAKGGPIQPVKKHKLHTLQLHLKTEENDKQRIIAHAMKFLEKRDQVRVVLRLKGRERSKPGIAIAYLQEIIESLSEYGTPASTPTPANLSVVFNPGKRK